MVPILQKDVTKILRFPPPSFTNEYSIKSEVPSSSSKFQHS